MEGARNEPQRAVAETLRGTRGCVSAEREVRGRERTARRRVPVGWREEGTRLCAPGPRTARHSRRRGLPAAGRGARVQTASALLGSRTLSSDKTQHRAIRPRPLGRPHPTDRERTIHPFQQPHLQMEQRRLREGRRLAGAGGSPPLNALPSALCLSLTSQLVLWAFGDRGFHRQYRLSEAGDPTRRSPWLRVAEGWAGGTWGCEATSRVPVFPPSSFHPLGVSPCGSP